MYGARFAFQKEARARLSPCTFSGVARLENEAKKRILQFSRKSTERISQGPYVLVLSLDKRFFLYVNTHVIGVTCLTDDPCLPSNHFSLHAYERTYNTFRIIIVLKTVVNYTHVVNYIDIYIK